MTAAGSFAGHLLSKQTSFFTGLRYAIYNATLKPQRLREPLYPQRTAVVLIGDDEYWNEPLAGRVPVKRDYLAALISRIADAKPAAVALDFDLRLAHNDWSHDFSDYQTQEDARLLESIKQASIKTAIVLPVTVGMNAQGEYSCQPSMLDPKCECAPTGHCGYIQLPYDLRRIPLSLDAGEKSVDSFSEAAIKVLDPEAYRRVEDAGANALPFGDYMAESEFKDRVLSASDVLNSSPARLEEKVAHRVVFIGAAWNLFGYKMGPRVDEHAAPVGHVPGAMLHANYVESALARRVYRPLSEGVVEAIEVATVLAMAILAALQVPIGVKWAVSLSAVFIFLSCSLFLLQNLGIFLDFFIPTLVLAAHFTAEKVMQWRKEAGLHRKAVAA